MPKKLIEQNLCLVIKDSKVSLQEIIITTGLVFAALLVT